MPSTIVECPATATATSAVDRLPVEMWHRILALVVHIPHLDSTYDDAFAQSRRRCSVHAVQRAAAAARAAARVLARVCAPWRAFVAAHEHQAIVLAAPHDWARALAAIRPTGAEGAEGAPPRLLTATRRIDVLCALGDMGSEVQARLRALEELIRACPHLCTLRIQEPPYPRVLRSPATTHALHTWPAPAACPREPDAHGGGSARHPATALGPAAARLRALHFHPQFDTEHVERALDWSALRGLARAFPNLRLLSCTVACSSRWDAFRAPFAAACAGVALPLLEILHIAWMADEAGADEAAVHLPHYFRTWDLPRLRHLRVHRVTSASWGIILALLNHNSPKLESLSINEVDDDYGSIPKQFWEQCPNVTTLMGELERFDSLGIPTGHPSLRQLGYTRPSSHFGDNTHFREKTVREIGEQIKFDLPARAHLAVRFVECSFQELCVGASCAGTVLVPPLVEELRSLANICAHRGYRLLDGDGVEVSSFFRQDCRELAA